MREIDVSCEATAPEKLTPVNSSCIAHSYFKSNPVQETCRNGKSTATISSTRQTTLDKFIGVSASNLKQRTEKGEFSNGSCDNVSYVDVTGDKNRGVSKCVDIEMSSTFVKIDPEAAETWVYPGSFLSKEISFLCGNFTMFPYFFTFYLLIFLGSCGGGWGLRASGSFWVWKVTMHDEGAIFQAYSPNYQVDNMHPAVNLLSRVMTTYI